MWTLAFIDEAVGEGQVVTLNSHKI